MSLSITGTEILALLPTARDFIHLIHSNSSPTTRFARASASLTDAAQELALCANMPAVIQGQGIIDAINALAGQVQQQMQQIQQQIVGLHDRLDSFAIEMRAR